MLTTYSIPSQSMYRVVIHITQDLLKNQVISPITQEFHMTLDLWLEYWYALCYGIYMNVKIAEVT